MTRKKINYQRSRKLSSGPLESCSLTSSISLNSDVVTCFLRSSLRAHIVLVCLSSWFSNTDCSSSKSLVVLEEEVLLEEVSPPALASFGFSSISRVLFLLALPLDVGCCRPPFSSCSSSVPETKVSVTYSKKPIS